MGNVDNVLLLLQHGADPEAVTKDGYTPLHIAAKEGHEDVISVLIDQSASPNSVTKVCLSSLLSPSHTLSTANPKSIYH